MSPTFLGMVFVALLLLVFWRAMLLVLCAVLLAAVAIGLGIAPEVQAVDPAPPPAVEQSLDPPPEAAQGPDVPPR